MKGLGYARIHRDAWRPRRITLILIGMIIGLLVAFPFADVIVRVGP